MAHQRLPFALFASALLRPIPAAATLFVAVLATSRPASTSAAVVGTNSPPFSLTEERLVELPPQDRAAWRDYLDQSARQKRVDQAFLAVEVRAAGFARPLVPKSGRSAASIPLDKDPAWYGGPEAARLADVIVSFQTPAGGWSKNLAFDRPRRTGESFAPNNLTHFPSAGDFDAPHDPAWSYVGTFDNDATNTEMRFLAKVIAAAPAGTGAPWRAAFGRGLAYIFASQYPNGGWPQVWPLEGGYHDAITYNDDAMTETLDLLERVAHGRGEFGFADPGVRAMALKRLYLGLQCVLSTQVVEKGASTAWCQQYDPLTLKPEAARNYEMPALSSAESADLLLFLMGIQTRKQALIRCVRTGTRWLRNTAITGFEWKREEDGRRLVASPGAGPLWSRFYEIGTDRPVFGDRDKTIHDTVAEISLERRNGYNWYGDQPARELAVFSTWRLCHNLE